MYACGPTVYNFAHIGNLRAYIFEDILKRILLYNDYQVKHIINITDVGHLTSDADEGEDKIAKSAAAHGKTARQIADFYTKAFQKDLKALNILQPDKFPKATENIKEQIALIKKLEKKGYTYKTSDGVYFDTAKLPDYGRLANLKSQKLKAGARIELGEKKNITDFALWKFSHRSTTVIPTAVDLPATLSLARRAGESLKPKIKGSLDSATAPLGMTKIGAKRQMEWPSPWGVGFPGWHIECSAMAAKYLGQPFDIHCGGIDHVPVHHTNEIAQSEAATGKPLAHYWLHGEFVVFNSSPNESTPEKMSKSADNFITLQTLKTRNFNPLAYRYLLLQTHYRKQLNFSWDALQAAQNGLHHLYNIIRTWDNNKTGPTCKEYEDKFLEAINNDLDTPTALSIMWDFLKNPMYPGSAKRKTLLKFDEIFGLGLTRIAFWREEAHIKRKKVSLPVEITTLSAERDGARFSKNWKKSDELRKKIEAAGYSVEDTPEGTRIEKKYV